MLSVSLYEHLIGKQECKAIVRIIAEVKCHVLVCMRVCNVYYQL